MLRVSLFVIANAINLAILCAKYVGLYRFLESSELLNDVFEKRCAHFVCFVFFVRQGFRATF